ncbi:MAG: hypothetical protein ACOCSR_01730 [Wenzhouxiangella sp.]
MKKLIVGIVVLLPLAALAAHFYFTSRLEQQVEEIAGQVAMFGSLEWDDVSIHPRGEASISGLNFAPHMAGEELRIARISIAAPNYLALLRSTAELDEERLPEELGLSLHGVRIPLTGPAVELVEAEFGSGLPYESAGCGNRTTGFSARDLEAMGYRELDVSLDLSYRLIGNGESMALSASTRTREVSAVEFDLEVHLGSGSRDLDLLARAWSMARLIEAEVHYRNLGFREAINAFCAARNDMDRAHYREHHLNQWIEAWSRDGLVPADDLVMAYREFLERPESVRIDLRPERQVPLSSFNRVSREELFDKLDPDISINGGSGRALQFRQSPTTALSDTASTAEAREPGSTENSGQPQSSGSQDEESDIPAQDHPSAWLTVTFDEAFDHVDAPIRVTMPGGKLVRGRLTAAEDDVLHVRVHGVGGYFVRPFSRTQVADIEVRRR